MGYKKITIYIILIFLAIVVLFLLTCIDRDQSQSPVSGSEESTADAVNSDIMENAKQETNTSHITNDRMVVYINWDGFAWYYYECANKGELAGTPVMNSLIKEGVLFSDTCTGIPSITNPMQTSILTGAWPSVTGNCYQYFDRHSSKILKTGRENRAENLAEAITRQGFRAASIHQFILENRGTFAASKENPYVQLGNNADYAARFDEAINFVKSMKVYSPAASINENIMPAFLAIYMDDLDGIGHNSWFTYGVPPVKSESERLESILKRLKLMDAKLGVFIQACREAGIYDKVSFLLTSDHGMTPYGIQNGLDDGCGYSKLPDLVNALQSMDYKTEVLSEGKGPKKDTDIVLAPTGLQVQLFFTGQDDKPDVDRITAALTKKEYIGVVMSKTELIRRGSADEFADMLISPKPPYSFKNDKKLHKAGGQHDSLDESSQHVFALMWGSGIKKGFAYDEKIYVIDFAKTISSLLGIDSPKDSTGRLLEGALEGF